MFKINTIFCILTWVIFLSVIWWKDIHYEQNVGGFLKQAADANNTSMAEQKLSQASDGMQRLGLCNGGGDNCFTSVFYRTPDEDVGFWRANIETTLRDLQAMPDKERSDNLIESNQLIKVRETLMDNGGNGDFVTHPKGISRYPNNALFGVIQAFLIIYVIVLLVWAHRKF